MREERADLPPKPLAEEVHNLLIQTAAHMRSTGNPNFKFGPRGGIEAILEVLGTFKVSYKNEFTQWRNGKKDDSEGRQSGRTRKLIDLLEGNGAKHVYGKHLGAYHALVAYWETVDHLPKLLASLKAFELELARLVNETKADRLARRISPARDYWRDPLGLPPPQVVALEREGRRRAAIEWLTTSGALRANLENLIHLLRLNEQDGGSESALNFFNSQRDHFLGKVNASVASAEKYFQARVLSQIGKIEAALVLHEGNVAPENPHPLYTHKSEFEIAQLHYRLENFSRSKKLFQELITKLESRPGAPVELQVDILKFVSTHESLHTIFTSPRADVVLSDLDQGNAQRALSLARQAIDLATTADYIDGLAWSHTACAFAQEALGDFEQANREYCIAERYYRDPRAHGSSAGYIRLFHSGMVRRSGDFDTAKKLLTELENDLGPTLRGSAKAELLIQRAIIAEKEGLPNEALDYHEQGLRLLAQDVRVRSMSGWGIVKRLRKTCLAILNCSLDDLSHNCGQLG